ncbi:MAG: tRNA lysidine(34) synthetase TilS, partial [Anaerolineales bacterium]|nr:tRNA lysidine(34) synthetase TilS [Anaerolineales bacterium]
INSSVRSARVDLKAGLRMFREAQLIHICKRDAVLPLSLWPQLPEGASIPIFPAEEAALAGGWKLNCERSPLPARAREEAGRNQDQFQVWLDAENLPGSFELRRRRPGDCFQPLGMDGHSQKVTDFFVNEKVPQRARAGWPLLCAGQEIVWVPGYRASHSHRLTESTESVIYFSITHTPDKI